MSLSCAPNDLANAAKCFQCYDDRQMTIVQTYLLAVIAGGSTDPNVLAKAAKAFEGLDDKTLIQIQDYLLCQIA